MTPLQIRLRRSGLSVAIIGLFFALAVLPALHPLAQVFLQIAYWPVSTVPPGVGVPAGVLLAISGGLTVGIGAAMWALGTHVAGRQPDAAIRVTRVMAWSWFVTDSTASIMAGAPMNAALNLSFLALMLWAARSEAGAPAPA